jgi:hypothetical protein
MFINFGWQNMKCKERIKKERNKGEEEKREIRMNEDVIYVQISV